jgi:site-specific recombinase XerD
MIVPGRKAKNGEPIYQPMNDVVRAILCRLPSRLKSEWVFPSASSATPLDPRNFCRNVFRPALKRACITNLRWHDLRHTFGTRLAQEDVDTRTIQELMAHQDISTTMRYTHIASKRKLEAVQRLTSRGTGTVTGTTPAEQGGIRARPRK